MKAVLLSVLLLAGCSSNTAWRVSVGTPPPDALVHVHSSSDLAAAFGLMIMAAGVYASTSAFERNGDGGFSRRAPEMAPDRKVSEQDCTRPLESFSGNLKCR